MSSDKEREYFSDGLTEELLNALVKIPAWRCETDAAFAWLDKAMAARYPGMAQIKINVYLRSLYAGPRWNPLLKKVGLPTD